MHPGHCLIYVMPQDGHAWMFYVSDEFFAFKDFISGSPQDILFKDVGPPHLEEPS